MIISVTIAGVECFAPEDRFTRIKRPSEEPCQTKNDDVTGKSATPTEKPIKPSTT